MSTGADARARPRVLLVSTATRWLGTARMPRVLARAGFEVLLLTPPNSLAEASGYVARVDFIPGDATPIDWLHALADATERHLPRLLVPCDEMALRLLFTLVLDRRGTLPPLRQAAIERLVVESLGDPAHYAASIDKTALPWVAERLGVTMPAWAVAHGVDDAVAKAEAIGFPVLVKRRFGFAGEGVRFADSLDDVAGAARRMLQPDVLDLGERMLPQVLVQAFVDGPYHSQAMAAWHGTPLAAFAWERHVATRARKGQTSVLRFVDSPATREAAERLCTALGMSGFFNAQFVLDGAGRPHLLEINRRIVTHMHLGERVGCDLGEALFAAVTGRRPIVRAPAVDGNDRIVIFPREWLRDPASPNLDRWPADIPWDEPRLLAAMAAMWRET